jgi:hypothetical protein
MVGGAPTVSIPARVAARLLACVVRGGRRVPAAAAAACWLVVGARARPGRVRRARAAPR